MFVYILSKLNQANERVQRNQGKDGEEAGRESSKKDAELAKTRGFSLLNGKEKR